MSLVSLNDVLCLSARVLCEVMRGRSLPNALSIVPISNFQLPAVRFASYDVVRNLNYVEAVLSSRLISGRGRKWTPFFHSLMLVAISKLDADTDHAYAIVDQVVAIVKRGRHGYLSGLANAVLRGYLRERESLQERLLKSDSLRYRLPEWWIVRLRELYPDNWEELAQTLLGHPPMSLRVNRRKISLQKYRDILDSLTFYHRAINPSAIVLNSPCSQSGLPYYEEGYVSVQDFGAQQVTAFMNLKEGDCLLDACCGSGGKLTAILESFDGIVATAVDSCSDRLFRLRGELSRLGLEATAVHADLFDVSSWWDGRLFDAIVLDVPCSGSGSVRRHVCAKWNKKEEDLLNFAGIQSNMLATVWPLLKRGGQLLYVTCSLFEEENTFPLKALTERFTDVFVACLSEQQGSRRWGVCLCPGPYSDGFFYASLTKK
ncbi:16S rRNA methyltransferase B [Candidatus Ichthyocystis hellenicum]|uniref:16S rRNA methyltransferase B n=1 Tax=Candidatus Ichthyocystis hellenicum TaxID=1561003 RepID=A0A0S4M4G4_9BURK|nr:transcription antitermination factor NusB [Candidatus Ichthyocystis hellenicum]CUT17165.1 16S rRNA methyltransferase B [Candidatus Ichthyocystis hellenicum]